MLCKECYLISNSKTDHQWIATKLAQEVCMGWMIYPLTWFPSIAFSDTTSIAYKYAHVHIISTQSKPQSVEIICLTFDALLKLDFYSPRVVTDSRAKSRSQTTVVRRHNRWTGCFTTVRPALPRQVCRVVGSIQHRIVQTSSVFVELYSLVGWITTAALACSLRKVTGWIPPSSHSFGVGGVISTLLGLFTSLWFRINSSSPHSLINVVINLLNFSKHCKSALLHTIIYSSHLVPFR